MNSAEKENRVSVDGKSCRLTPLEYGVYTLLKRNAGDTLSRELLLRQVWGYLSDADTRSVDMCVKRLRDKIGTKRIRTVYGKGYCLLTEAEM